MNKKVKKTPDLDTAEGAGEGGMTAYGVFCSLYWIGGHKGQRLAELIDGGGRDDADLSAKNLMDKDGTLNPKKYKRGRRKNTGRRGRTT